MCADQATPSTDRRGFLAAAADSLAAIAGTAMTSQATSLPPADEDLDDVDEEKEIFPPSDHPQPDGIYLIANGNHHGILIIDGVLFAFALESSETAEDWQVTRRVSLVPAGTFETFQDRAGINVHFMEGEWRCCQCKTHHGMCEALDCKHVQAAAYLYFHIFYRHN